MTLLDSVLLALCQLTMMSDDDELYVAFGGRNLSVNVGDDGNGVTEMELHVMNY